MSGSIDTIGSYYTNNVEPRSVRTVIATPVISAFPSGGGTAAYVGLFGAGSLITNITASSNTALTSNCTISAYGTSAGLTAAIVTFASGSVTTITTPLGAQFGVTLPQDSWLVASGTGASVPNLVVSYLS